MEKYARGGFCKAVQDIMNISVEKFGVEYAADLAAVKFVYSPYSSASFLKAGKERFIISGETQYATRT